MAHLLTILGIFSLVSSCLAASCSYENMLIRMKNCTTMQTSATTVEGLKRQLNAFCTDIDDHIQCQETALGNDCDGHFSKVGNRVGAAILCANVHDSVEALYNCRTITPTCGERYANAILEASSTYIKTDDISQLRADMCRAFDLLKDDCFPVRSNSICPTDYAAFAEDLLELTVAAPVCPNRNMSDMYLKYGFTATGEPIPGHSHKMIRYITTTRRTTTFRPSYRHTTTFRPSNSRTTTFRPSNRRTTTFRPSNSRTTTFRPSNRRTTTFRPSNHRTTPSSSSFVSLSNVLTLTVFVIGFRSLNIATF